MEQKQHDPPRPPPNEIISLIGEHLYHSVDSTTLCNLQTLSQSTYGFITPVIYHKVSLPSLEAYHRFLYTPHSGFCIQKRAEPYNKAHSDGVLWDDSMTPEEWKRFLDAMLYVRDLTVGPVSAAQLDRFTDDLCDAASKSGRSCLMPNIERLNVESTVTPQRPWHNPIINSNLVSPCHVVVDDARSWFDIDDDDLRPEEVTIRNGTYHFLDQNYRPGVLYHIQVRLHLGNLSVSPSRVEEIISEHRAIVLPWIVAPPTLPHPVDVPVERPRWQLHLPRLEFGSVGHVTHLINTYITTFAEGLEKMDFGADTKASMRVGKAGKDFASYLRIEEAVTIVPHPIVGADAWAELRDMLRRSGVWPV